MIVHVNDPEANTCRSAVVLDPRGIESGRIERGPLYLRVFVPGPVTELVGSGDIEAVIPHVSGAVWVPNPGGHTSRPLASWHTPAECLTADPGDHYVGR